MKLLNGRNIPKKYEDLVRKRTKKFIEITGGLDEAEEALKQWGLSGTDVRSQLECKLAFSPIVYGFMALYTKLVMNNITP